MIKLQSAGEMPEVKLRMPVMFGGSGFIAYFDLTFEENSERDLYEQGRFSPFSVPEGVSATAVQHSSPVGEIPCCSSWWCKSTIPSAPRQPIHDPSSQKHPKQTLPGEIFPDSSNDLLGGL